MLLSMLALFSCKKVGCLTGTDEDCVVPPACDALVTECEGGQSEVFRIAPGEAPPLSGASALGAEGDIVLRNDKIVAVLDALDHPHYVAPSGGSVLDLAPLGGSDGLCNLFQATGLLPGDAVHYTEVKLLDEGPIKAVQYRGTLDGHPDIHVATRYEIRPCEDGLRIRTEVVNREPEPYPMFLLDAFYWGGGQFIPFTPYSGFDQPSFGLTTLTDGIRAVPWMTGGLHGGGASSYGLTPCDREAIEGVQSQEISAVGPTRRVLFPRDYEVYERFLSVAEGPALSETIDVLLGVRERLRGEPFVTIEGKVALDDGGEAGSLARASLVARGADGPMTQAIPDAQGNYRFRVPPGTWTLQAEMFGRQGPSVTVHADTDARAEDLLLPGPGEITLEALVDGQPDLLLAFVYPADEAQAEALLGSVHGQTEACAPMLGHPFGGSPACNRVLIDGSTTVELPDGLYDIYATAGPFSTMAAVQRVRVDSGTAQSVLLEVETLPLQPEGTLSADFHVHGRASFDSSLPDADRVRSFLAARVDVVASTDHDAINDYAEALADLAIDHPDLPERLAVLVGLETTGHVLFPLVETTIYPKVIGHFIFWPVPYDETAPYRGAPWDELVEPGQLFERVRGAGWPEWGVVQLNHPWGGIQFGRDFAWPTAIGLDLTKPLPRTYDGTGQGLFLRKPPGAAFSNADYHAQEVMNGTENAAFVQYRAIWHYLLSEGVVRAGTANSDTHRLTDNVLGTPRNLVWTSATLADWDQATFNADVRAGRMLGTNGPVLVVSTTDAQGAPRRPSLEPFTPAGDSALSIELSAAPWVPVEEVRILVNGEVARTLSELPLPDDPLGTDGLLRLQTEIPLAELLPAGKYAWIVVEAGSPLHPAKDFDCNGIPDTGDNDGNGRIDWRDVEGLTEDPGADCFDTVGPLPRLPPPSRDEPRFFFDRVTPGGEPTAFTNPLLIDVDGDGFSGARAR